MGLFRAFVYRPAGPRVSFSPQSHLSPMCLCVHKWSHDRLVTWKPSWSP
jgi:hypothetical protein